MTSSYPDLFLLIDGEKLSEVGRVREDVINPATESVLGRLPHASTQDLTRSAEAARRAATTWRLTSAAARGRILKHAAELLRVRSEQIAYAATLEQGKCLAESRLEVGMAADTLEWFGEEGRRAYGRVLQSSSPGNRALVVKEPVGVVAAFAPWNFPIANPARKLGSALAAGCPCILKPAEEAPASALAVASALIDAGLPPGVMAVVFGRPAEVSQHLLASNVVRKISFTGSLPVGKHLLTLATHNLQRTTMELGGHAPVIVFDDADLDRALDLTVASKFRNAGQVCVAPTRFIVQDSIYERFVTGFLERTRSLNVGDGLDEKNRMGPLTHPRRLEAMSSFVTDAISHGARLLTGCVRLER